MSGAHHRRFERAANNDNEDRSNAEARGSCSEAALTRHVVSGVMLRCGSVSQHEGSVTDSRSQQSWDLQESWFADLKGSALSRKSASSKH